MENTQSFKQTVAGQLKAIELTLAGTTQPQTLVSAIHYNAFNTPGAIAAQAVEAGKSRNSRSSTKASETLRKPDMGWT